MAETKKTAVVKPVAKPVAKAADTVTPEVKTTPVASVAEVKKEEVKKVEPKKTEAKKTTAKKAAPAKKTAAKKETVKKAPAKKEAPVKKAVKETVHVQFSGKTYTTEDLVKIAKDVWTYDLQKKASDFKSVELYVKPEESVVYYVINDEEKGSFGI